VALLSEAEQDAVELGLLTIVPAGAVANLWEPAPAVDRFTPIAKIDPRPMISALRTEVLDNDVLEPRKSASMGGIIFDWWKFQPVGGLSVASQSG
jgi:hypothetical protein